MIARHLIFATAAVTYLAGAGCSLSDHDSGLRRLVISWRLLGADGQALTCDQAGAPYVNIEVARGGRQEFACTAGRGEIFQLPEAGRASVSAQLLSGFRGVIASDSLDEIALSDRGATTAMATLTVRAGAFSTDWTLQVFGGQTVSCEAANVDLVRLRFAPQPSGASREETFPCDAGRAVTQASSLGAYEASAVLLRGNRALSAVDFGLLSPSAVTTTDMGSILFRVQALQLTWKIEGTAPDGGGAQAIECQKIAAQTVSVRLAPTDGSPAQELSFSCTAGKGTSPALHAGSYQLTTCLRAADDRMLQCVGPRNFDVPREFPLAYASVLFNLP